MATYSVFPSGSGFSILPSWPTKTCNLSTKVTTVDNLYAAEDSAIDEAGAWRVAGHRRTGESRTASFFRS